MDWKETRTDKYIHSSGQTDQASSILGCWWRREDRLKRYSGHKSEEGDLMRYEMEESKVSRKTGSLNIKAKPQN